MIILKAVGAFFVKIWRWIKETAWVQPLLIVGAIFAIIFSIPSITSWVNSLQYTSKDAFFNSQKKTLEGEVDADAMGTDKDYSSVADQITNDIFSNHNKVNPKSGDPTAPSTSTYGEEFFFIYTASDCDSCSTAESGTKFLSDNWDDYYVSGSSKSTGSSTFRFYTIFTDEASSNDDDYDFADINDTAFRRYLGKYLDFFNTTAAKIEDSPYKINQSIDDTNYGYYEQPDLTKFSTPTVLLCDFTQAAIDAGRAGVSEVLFGLSGSTDKDKADLLFKMWNHTSNDSTNPFSTAYRS